MRAVRRPNRAVPTHRLVLTNPHDPQAPHRLCVPIDAETYALYVSLAPAEQASMAQVLRMVLDDKIRGWYRARTEAPVEDREYDFTVGDSNVEELHRDP